ncbi:MAG: hypothetical protein DMF75_16470 [Acidobacteria bacterium]|nr:MAG: hypothetical protein DMF75_16470 [Acidobacteriota bacterium]
MADQNTDRYDLIYKENAKIVAIFWEWRHKELTIFFAGMAGLFALSSWLYQNQRPELHGLFGAPFIIGVAFCIVSLLLDIRNARILKDCYRIGQEIEKKWCDRGILSEEAVIFVAVGRKQGITYTRVLRILYITSALSLAFLAYWLPEKLK